MKSLTAKRKISPPARTPPEVKLKTVVIAEDQTTVREMTHEVLKMLSCYKVLATAADGVAAVDLTLKHKPDILLLDVMMPPFSGIEVLRRVKQSIPHLRVLVFSAKQEPSIVRSLIQEGMHGFVNKSSPLEELRQAINIVSSGGQWFNEDFSRTVREALARPSHQSEHMIERLTPREREISCLIAQSHSSKEVASRLNISVKTSENHRANLMRKLGVHDVAGLVRFAIRHGLIDASEP
jgi:DNA-binding NarL/FixJ family response regulator